VSEMGIGEMIRRDHDEVRRMIAKMEKDADVRSTVLPDLVKIAFAHWKAEEATVGVAMLKVPDLKGLAYDIIEEHRALRTLMGDLGSLDVKGELWMHRLAPIKTLLDTHFAKEETVVIPFAPMYFTAAQLDDVGKAFENIESKELKVPILAH
jgi:hemerythrin superfamily protein